MPEMSQLKRNFLWDASGVKHKVLVVAIEQPNGAIDIITSTDMIDEKILWYQNEYDDEFKLKRNPDVRVVGYMLV